MKKIISFVIGLTLSSIVFAQTPTGYPWQQGQVLTSSTLNAAFAARTTFSSGPLTLYGVLLGNGSGDIAPLGSFGITGQVLTSNGAGLAPSWVNNAYNASNVTITGGTINNTSVGASTQSSGSFTSLAASATVSGTGFTNLFAAPPTIGSTTPGAAYFTTLSTTTAIPITSGGTGNTTGTATVNANLTGPITSVGNATSVASQTGTGSTFVMQIGPTLTTPNIGVASGTSVTVTGAYTAAVGSISSPAYTYTGNTTSGWFYNTTDSALAATVGGTEYYEISANGAYTNGSQQIGPGNAYLWGSSSFTSGADLVLARDGAGQMAQRNGTNAQTFRLYNTWTAFNNNESLGLISSYSGSDFGITTQAQGAGVLRQLYINAANTYLQNRGTTVAEVTSTGLTTNTPAQFNASTEAATTAFVQQAIGNYSSTPTVGGGGSQVLTNTNAGNMIITTGSGGTITLPAVAGLVAGTTITVQALFASGTTIIKGHASESIFNPLQGSANTFTLNAGQSAQFVTDTSEWLVVSIGNYVLSGTSGSIGGSALIAGQTTTGTVSIPFATTSMGVVVTPTTYPGAGVGWSGYVSSTGTVTVVVTGIIAVTPTATTYNVRVIP